MTCTLIAANCPFNGHTFWWKMCTSWHLFLCQALTFDLMTKRRNCLFFVSSPSIFMYPVFLFFYIYIILTSSSPPQYLLFTSSSWLLFLYLLLLFLILSSSTIISSSSLLLSCKAIYLNLTWPLCARVLLPSPSLHTAWWFAEPRAAPNQWTGLLLATMETYNMPGNHGNHRGGTGPMAIDTYPPTRLVSVMCDLHPWFLSKRPLSHLLNKSDWFCIRQTIIFYSIKE